MLSDAKTLKNRQNMVLKTIPFLNVDFEVFFSGSYRFWLNFGRLWASKKLLKIAKNRVWTTLATP